MVPSPAGQRARRAPTIRASWRPAGIHARSSGRVCWPIQVATSMLEVALAPASNMLLTWLQAIEGASEVRLSALEPRPLDNATCCAPLTIPPRCGLPVLQEPFSGTPDDRSRRGTHRHRRAVPLSRVHAKAWKSRRGTGLRRDLPRCLRSRGNPTPDRRASSNGRSALRPGGHLVVTAPWRSTLAMQRAGSGWNGCLVRRASGRCCVPLHRHPMSCLFTCARLRAVAGPGSGAGLRRSSAGSASPFPGRPSSMVKA